MTGIVEIETARSRIPRALFIVPEDRSASWQWRVAWPCEFLSNHGYIADWCTAQYAPTAVPMIAQGRYNMVITERIAWPSSNMHSEFEKLVHDTNLAWVYGLDDDGWAPDIAKRQAELIMTEWKKGDIQLQQDRQDRIDMIQHTDAVIVSSEPLADVARRHTPKPVFCVPNLIHSEFFQQKIAVSKRQFSPLTIGWSGGLREESDLINVAKAWRVIVERYPDVTFIVHGTRPQCLLDAVPPGRILCLPWTALPDYPRALMNIDIAVCSVAANRQFNQGKTCIKWYEATLAGASCVVSRELYGREVVDGKTALIAEEPEEWVQALSRLIEDVSLRKKLQRNAKKEVIAQHSMEHQWKQWVEVLSNTLDMYSTSRNGLVHA